jgi:hypothetical protein
MDIFSEIDSSYLADNGEAFRRAQLVVLDANVSPETFSTVGRFCRTNNLPLVSFINYYIYSTSSTSLLSYYFFCESQFFDPTSDHKCVLPLMVDGGLSYLSVIKPSMSELTAMVKYGLEKGMFASTSCRYLDL